MSNIVKLYTNNSAEDPDNVLEQAIGSYESVIILGWDKNEMLDPRASTNLTSREILWLLSVFKNNLINGEYRAE